MYFNSKDQSCVIFERNYKSQHLQLQPHIELAVVTSNDTIIRSVIVFAEGLFEGESHVVHPPPSKLSNTIKVPLFPQKDTPVELNVKVFVGQVSSTQYHVFEASRPLPRFSLYIPCSVDIQPRPIGTVTFNLSERLDRLKSWIDDSFMYAPGDDAVTTPTLSVAYLSLRTNSPLLMTMDPAQSGKTTLHTDDMDLAGDIIQSLATYLGIEDLEVVAEFPKHMEELRSVLSQVDEYHKVRQRLTAEMADNSGVIRNLVVRAEDARMINDMTNMKKAYMQLYDLNKDIVTGYKIRSNNHMELLECLKIVNQAIQKAGKLRVGRPKAKVISGCRTAIKNKEVETLFKIMRSGAN
ncbi:Bardet-Biedl syndrome 2 protein homolog [Halichondria panicea]|uniref:Bardet-Biedl syndrome 2 protein homolog n=1 Tax=Halichondria panicea TaxID=6063 RepID=UPI00312B81F5